jgi:hypothetical protein
MPDLERAMKPIVKKPLIDKKVKPDAGNKKRLILAAAGLLLVLLLGAWYLSVGEDPQIALVKELQRELFTNKDLPAEERKQKWEQVRAEEAKLSAEQKVTLRKEMSSQFMAKMNAQAAQYFAMSPEERQKVIDQKINEMQRWMAMAAKRGPGGQGFRGPGPAGPQLAVGPGGGQPPKAGPGAPGGPAAFKGPWGEAPKTPEEGDLMLRNMILKSTPQARAGMDQMRLDMAARRAKLGMPAMPGPGGPGGGPGRGGGR